MRKRNAILVVVALATAGLFGAVLAWKVSSPRAGEVVVVSAFSEGSSSPANEAQLAVPIENALAKLPGIKRLRTESRANEVRAFCSFEPGVDGFAATQDVQAAIRDLGRQLPETVAPPTTMRGGSDDRPLWAVGDADVRELLQAVPGVAQVEACGEMEDWVRVSIDPPRLAATALDLGAVVHALSAVPSARALPDVGALSGTVLTTANASAPVRLADIATVRVERRSTGCEANMLAEREILARITLQSGASPKSVAKLIADKVQSSGGRLFDPARTIVLALGFASGIGRGAVNVLTTKVAADLAAVSGVTKIVAARHDARSNEVELVVTIDPDAKRQTATELRTRVTSKWPGVAWRGVRSSPFGKTPVLTVTLKGADIEGFEERAREVKRRLTGVAGVGPEIGVDLHGVPFVHVEIDREQASRAGVRASDITDVVRAATAGLTVGPRMTVFLGADDRAGDPPLVALLPQLTVGKWPLSSLVRVTAEAQPSVIVRIDRQRAVELRWELDSSFSKRAVEGTLADMDASVDVSQL